MDFKIRQVSGDFDFNKLFKAIDENYVLVGIPQKEAARQNGPITNAELLYIHTNGSPINNIPKRPVIEPAMLDDRERLTKLLNAFLEAKIQGENEEANKMLGLVGMRAQNDARGWFVNPKNKWPPNSPGVRKYKIKKGSTNPNPLIDTGELRKSITYVVVKDGVRSND